jgi:flagellin
MSSNSIHTNVGAMVALQSLNATNRALDTVQNRISTGMKVGNAKDNAAAYAIASTMRTDLSSFKAIKETLSLGQAVVATARDASEQLIDLIDQIKSKVTAAQSPAMDGSKLQADVDALINQINGIVGSAQVNGVNMLNQTPSTARFLASVDRSSTGATASYINVTSQDMRTTNGGGLTSLEGLSVLNRGDVMFSNSTVADRMEATRRLVSNVIANDGLVTIEYTDGLGILRSVSVNTTGGGSAAGRVNILNNNPTFTSLFSAAVTGANVYLGFLSRSLDQSYSVSRVLFNGSAVSATTEQMSMSFQDAPMTLGEVIDLDYNVTGTAQRIRLQVANTSTGTILDTGVTNNIRVVAVNSGVVTAWNVTGGAVATEVRTALTTGTTAFSTAAATAGTRIQSTNAGNVMAFSTADWSDSIVRMTPPVTDYGQILGRVEIALSAAVNAAAAFGSAQLRLELQEDFISKQIDSFTAGIGTIVDADMSIESARLQALQVQQQLGVQSLSIANARPQQILSLFGGR